MLLTDIFVIHPSVFHDAIRNDYATPFKSSSRTFLNLLRNHFTKYGRKIGYTSGEAFEQLMKTPLGKTKTIWIIPDHLVEVDWSSYVPNSIKLPIDKSIVKLASALCIKDTPRIVSTTKNIDLGGASFHILTPKDAIDFYNHPNSTF